MNIGDTIQWKIAEGEGYSGIGKIISMSKYKGFENIYERIGNDFKKVTDNEYEDCDWENAERLVIETNNGIKMIEKTDVV